MSDTPPLESTAVEKESPVRKKSRKPRRKVGGIIPLIAYIVVNIIISAATMLAVLFFWEQRTPSNDDLCVLPTIAPTAAAVEEESEPVVAAIPPLEEEVIQIEIIYGAGYLEDEQVVLKRVGTSDLPLYRWRLEDGDGNQFTFPDLTLKSGATLNVNSRSGDSTVLELFWGADGAIWEQGETARIYDPQGNLRAEYVIP